jgi:hypothetical protein
LKIYGQRGENFAEYLCLEAYLRILLELDQIQVELEQFHRALKLNPKWAEFLSCAIDRAAVHVQDHTRGCRQGRRLNVLECYLTAIQSGSVTGTLGAQARLDRIIRPPDGPPFTAEEVEDIFLVQALLRRRAIEEAEVASPASRP